MFFSKLEKKLRGGYSSRLKRPEGGIMKKFAAAMLAGVALSISLVAVASAKDKVIGVSW